MGLPGADRTQERSITDDSFSLKLAYVVRRMTPAKSSTTPASARPLVFSEMVSFLLGIGSPRKEKQDSPKDPTKQEKLIKQQEEDR